MKNRTRFQKGFTLLELLVVISIIAILIALGAVSYTTAQKKGRDARRQGDIKAWAAAMEQYNAENSGSYPGANNCNPTTTYLPNGIPTDPKGASYTQYTTVSNCQLSTYCLCALLENATGGNKTTAAQAGGLCGANGAGAYFCVSNQQ